MPDLTLEMDPRDDAAYADSSRTACTTAQPAERPLLHLAAISLAVVLVSRIAVILSTNLFPDEALYVWLFKVDPFQFAPHPPGVPFLTGLGRLLLGHGEAAVRLGSFLLGTAAVGPVYLLARSIGGRAVACWSALAFLSVPIYGAIGCVATPDAPQLFFWSLALWTAWNALSTGSRLWWTATGVTLAVGLYVKYIIILFFPALALCVLLSPRRSEHLRSAGIWLAIAVAALLFAPPALLSQAAAGWTAVEYHLSDRQQLIFPSARESLIYFGIHAIYYSPLLYGLALAGLWHAGRAGWKRRDERLLFLFAFGAVPFLFFALIAMVTQRELSREQWDAPAYITALIAAALLLRERGAFGSVATVGAAEAIRDEGAAGAAGAAGDVAAPQVPASRSWRRLALAAPLLGLVMYAVVAYEGATARLSARIGEEPLFSSFFGWQALAQAADQAFTTLPPGPAPPFFLGNAFADVQQFDFYTQGPARRIITLDHSSSQRYGVTKVLEVNQINQGALDRIEPGTSAIYGLVVDSDPKQGIPPLDPRRLQKLQRFFQTVEQLPDRAVIVAGRPVAAIRLLRCLHLKPAEQRR